MARRTLSICIPVYNEAQILKTAVDRVEAMFKTSLPQYDLELVVTDNGSTDSTWQVIQELASSRPYLKAFRFSRNFGYQNSVFTGLSLSTGDAVVEMDADLEDPPEVIPRFVEKWEQGHEVVYGVRSKRYGPLLLRAAFAIFYKFLNKISEFKIPENAGDFRLLDRKVVDVLKALPERNLYLRGLVVYLGFKQIPVVFERQPRIGGTSKFRMLHYIVLAIDAITAFTKAPLRLVGALGVMLFLGSLSLAGYYLVGYFFYGSRLQGFPTLVILNLILHSITFIFLGILGEYLSRIFDDSKNRPRVIIRDSIHSKDHPLVL